MPTRIAHRGTALLILDMLSEFRFPDALRLLPSALRIAPRIARLRAHARASGMPVIYVNDTRGKWESDQTAFVKRCREPGARGSEIARQLEPAPEDYVIFKPRHSAFYATPLKELLAHVHARNDSPGHARSLLRRSRAQLVQTGHAGVSFLPRREIPTGRFTGNRNGSSLARGTL